MLDENEPTFEGKVVEFNGIGLWSSIVEVSIENEKEGLNLMFDRRSFDQMLDDMTSTPNKLLGLSVIVHGLPGQEWLEFSHPRTK